MRVLLLLLVWISFLSVNAQTPLDYTILNYTQRAPLAGYHQHMDSIHVNKKWQFSKYGGLSTGYGFSRAGASSYLSAPMGLQLTRQLNKNLYAFAGVSAAPAYINFNTLLNTPIADKSYPGSRLYNTNHFGLYSSIEAGLMYINEEKTFSISGSIHMERGNYPVYPTYRTGTNGQQPVNSRY